MLTRCGAIPLRRGRSYDGSHSGFEPSRGASQESGTRPRQCRPLGFVPDPPGFSRPLDAPPLGPGQRADHHVRPPGRHRAGVLPTARHARQRGGAAHDDGADHAQARQDPRQSGSLAIGDAQARPDPERRVRGTRHSLQPARPRDAASAHQADPAPAASRHPAELQPPRGRQRAGDAAGSRPRRRRHADRTRIQRGRGARACGAGGSDHAHRGVDR